MKRIPELDALRGLAAVSVVLYHAWPTVFFLGWAGVDLFFVLSGYLITTIILEQHRDPRFLRIFYFRRVLRIWPVYFSVLAAVLLLNSFAAHPYPTDGLPWHLVFLQNIQHYWSDVPPGFIYSFYPSWSVSLEEQFYLVWPALLMLAGFRRAAGVATALLVVAVALRVTGLHEHLLLARFDGLAAGAILAVLLRDEAKVAASRVMLVRLMMLIGAAGAAFLLCYAIRFWRSPVTHWQPALFVATSAATFGLVGLLVLFTRSSRLGFFRNPVFLYLGSLSYGLYMWHSPVLNYAPPALRAAGLTSGVLISLFTWVALIAVPMLSYHLLEKPVLSLRRLLPYESERSFSPSPRL